MNIRYVGKSVGKDLSPLSFWLEPTRYDFEISTSEGDDKILDVFIKEFELNCREQLEGC